MAKITPQDTRIPCALGGLVEGFSSAVARQANITTMWPSETAGRHLIKLTKLGLAEQIGTRALPAWHITPAGRAALMEGKDE